MGATGDGPSFGIHPSALGLEPIRRYTSILAETVAANDASTPIPTAGSWTLADLAIHMVEVQDFWAWIIEHRPSNPDDRVQPTNADDLDTTDIQPDQLAELLVDTNAALSTHLEKASLADRAWSWHPEHQTVEFTWRRQSHEALIHCFDAVLAVGAEWPTVSQELAADGLDELFTIMAGGVPDWAQYRRSDDRLAVEASDTGDHWTLEFGTITGRSPGGTDYADEPLIAVVDDSMPCGGRIQGRALDLDLWAWGRIGADNIVHEGDPMLVERLRRLVAESTE